MMRKRKLVAVAILAVFALTVPIVYAEETLQKPNVTLPPRWTIENEVAYPNAFAEHDPAGAGLLQCVNQDNGDEVKIFYEKAQNTYTSTELKNEANRLFSRDQTEDGWVNSQNGTKIVADVNAGFAKAYDSDLGLFLEDIVFVKDGYYFNVVTVYDATSESETAVYSVMNSISVGSSIFDGLLLFVIVGIVVAVILIAIVLLVVRRRKTRTVQQAPTPSSGSFPPPPPLV